MAALKMEFFFCVFMLFASQALSDCDFTVDHNGKPVQYDLGTLVNFGGGAYNVQDSVRPDVNTVRHTYWFNFCGNINPPMDMCEHTSGTTQNYAGQRTPETDCDPSTPGDCAAPVFQTFVKEGDKASSRCYRLAKKFSKDQKANATFYNPNNPSKGVVLEYTGGDQCGTNSDGSKRYRRFRIRVLCDGDDDGANIPDDEPIFEKPVCEYALTIMSKFGCPVTCGSVNGQLCGANGECGYDKSSQTSRCFCKSGFYGSTCTDTTIWVPADTAGLVTLSVIIVGLAVAIAVFVVLVWRRVKSLRLDPEAYSSMGGEMDMKTEDMESDDDEFDQEAATTNTHDEDI